MRFPLLTPLLTGVAFFVTFFYSVAASAAPTFADIIAGLDTTSPVLAEAKVRLTALREGYFSAQAFPNPTVFAEGQSLKDGAGKESEQAFGVQQSLGFLWSQPAKVAARRLEFEAGQAMYEETRRQLLVRIITAAATYQNLEQQRSLLDSLLVMVNHVQQSMQWRQREGDVSGYDAKRMEAEWMQLQRRKLQWLTDLNAAKTDWVEATGLSAEVLADLNIPAIREPAADHIEQVRQSAIEHRPLLQAKQKFADAGDRGYTAAKLNQFPDFSVGLGRKTIDPDFSGWLWRAEVELPVWGQKRSERRLARSERDRAATDYQAAMRLVQQEAQAAFETYFRLNTTPPSSANFSREDALLSVQRGAQLYANGEFSSAEFVDALRGSLDGLAAAQELQWERLKANLELRRVAGLPILEP